LENFDYIGAALSLSVLAFSVIVHEVAHGYVAYLLGDPTAQMANRLTFNPLHHIDPMGSVILPLILALSRSSVMLGWAKPVPIDPRYFRNPRRDNLLVSAAGVTANMLLAVCCGLVFRVLKPDLEGGLAALLFMACTTNVGLAVFNMVPIPPLDGSHVVATFMPRRMAEQYMALSQFGFLLIFGLLYAGMMGRVVMPVIWFLDAILLGLPFG